MTEHWTSEPGLAARLPVDADLSAPVTSEWDDTTRDLRGILHTLGNLDGEALDEAVHAVLAVVDAVPRAEHERVVAELAEERGSHMETAATMRRIRDDRELLKHSIRKLADELRETGETLDRGGMGYYVAASRLRQLVDGGQS